MTDVVEIAKKCRAELVAEIAKLDEFLGMAEKLMKFDHGNSKIAPETDLVLASRKTEAATNGIGTSA